MAENSEVVLNFEVDGTHAAVVQVAAAVAAAVSEDSDFDAASDDVDLHAGVTVEPVAALEALVPVAAAASDAVSGLPVAASVQECVVADCDLPVDIENYRQSFNGGAACSTESGKYDGVIRWTNNAQHDKSVSPNTKQELNAQCNEIWNNVYADALDAQNTPLQEEQAEGFHRSEKNVYKYIYQVMEKNKNNKTAKLLLSALLNKGVFPISYNVAQNRDLFDNDISKDDFLYMCRGIPSNLPSWIQYHEKRNGDHLYSYATEREEQRPKTKVYKSLVLMGKNKAYAELVIKENKNFQFLPAFIYNVLKSFTLHNKSANFTIRTNFNENEEKEKIQNVLQAWFGFKVDKNTGDVSGTMKNIRAALRKISLKKDKWFVYNSSKTEVEDQDTELFLQDNWMIMFFKLGDKNVRKISNKIKSKDLRGFVFVRDDIYPDYTISKRVDNVPNKPPWSMVPAVPQEFDFVKNNRHQNILQINTVCRSLHREPKGIGALMIMWSWILHSNSNYSGTFLDVARIESDNAHGATKSTSAPAPDVVNMYHQKLKFQRMFTFPHDENDIRFKRWKAAFSRTNKKIGFKFVHSETHLDSIQALENIFSPFEIFENPPYIRTFDADYKKKNALLLINPKGAVNEDNVADYAMYRPYPTLDQINSLIYDALK